TVALLTPASFATASIESPTAPSRRTTLSRFIVSPGEVVPAPSHPTSCGQQQITWMRIKNHYNLLIIIFKF
ncbi:TPA: hypothetical protein ACF04H_005550, partial [Klebsiella pneumoniae]